MRNEGVVLDHHVLEIGPAAQSALGRQLGWYTPFIKPHPDGFDYQTYAGLHYYLITEGDNKRFLKASTKEELQASKNYRWENVKGLEVKLGYALKYVLKQSPMTVQLIHQLGPDVEVIWTEPFRELKQAEKRWMRVVRNSIREIQMEV